MVSLLLSDPFDCLTRSSLPPSLSSAFGAYCSSSWLESKSHVDERLSVPRFVPLKVCSILPLTLYHAFSHRSPRRMSVQGKARIKTPLRRKSKPLFLLDENNDKVWIATITLQDIKEKKAAVKRRSKTTSEQRKQLFLVPSPSTRQQIYDEAARALERLESRILPQYGERPWTVAVRIHDKDRTSPYFVWKQNRLQLAVWPHLLNKIPTPPRFPGYSSAARASKSTGTVHPSAAATAEKGSADVEEDVDDYDPEKEEEDDDDSIGLLEEEECELSRLAFDERWRVPMPEVSIKWISPLKQSFTTRKSAWDHAVQLCKQEVQIDKVLHGFGANGKPLKPTPPSQRSALTAGRLRFERDGLWVVGQEAAWQLERLANEVSTAATESTSFRPSKPHALSPLAYFIQCKRKEHQLKRQRELSEATLQQSSSPVDGIQPVEIDPPGASKRRGASGSSQSFTLLDSERELRCIWREMGVEEREHWARRSPLADHHSGVHTERNIPNEKTNSEPREAPLLGINSEVPSTTAISSPSPAVNAIGVVTPELDVKPQGIVGVGLLESTRKEIASSESCRWRLNAQQVKICYDAGMEHFDQIMRTVTARDLVRELQDGFDLLRERGRGRYDMELPVFDTSAFDFFTDLKKAPWMPIVREILGKDVVLIHKGMFLALPDAERQVYHQDGVHLTTQYQRAVHAINVFVPLVDMTLEHGPTEFCLGSHILGHEEYDEGGLVTPIVSAGTPIIFDYRLGHRGLANTSRESRPIVYCTYARAADGKEFRDTVNFSRKRYHRIGSLVTKAPSREERAQKRDQTALAELRQLTPRDLEFQTECHPQRKARIDVGRQHVERETATA